MNERIRVFLSGVVNDTNAQNLNCRALLEHLDPKRFDVRALTVYSGVLSAPQFRCFNYLIKYPARIWHPIRLIQGILWSDVAYLCKPEYWRLQQFLVWLFRKRAFRTIECAFIGTNLTKALAARGIAGSKQRLLEFLSFTAHVFSITESMREMNERAIGLRTCEQVLYLGVDVMRFKNDVSRSQLTDVAMIGSNLFYKGIDDFFLLARHFPNLTFHVIGSGMGKIVPTEEVHRLGLCNVICHGNESHEQLAEDLKSIQLHVLPSRAEGFPKVTLETAAAGVPSVVYDDYGAGEWIENGKSGFVVHTLDEMEVIVRDLLAHPEKLQPLANGARAMAWRFDWKVLVKDWEHVINELARR